MMEIPQEKYGELAVKLRALGAKLCHNTPC